jgi:hypothetical protein
VIQMPSIFRKGRDGGENGCFGKALSLAESGQRIQCSSVNKMRFAKLFGAIFFTFGLMFFQDSGRAAVDSEDKTILMPAGADGPIGELKKQFEKDGWKIQGDEDRKASEGAGEKPARYTLVIEWDFNPQAKEMFYYDIVVKDTKDSSSVAATNGYAGAPAIAEQLLEELKK